jgi:pSer/pThr/pTyr-binding forkhead associated (FHA) protein
LHAEITLLNNGDILLEDKNSMNGTFVMNHPIQPGTQVNIKRGDAIRFGDVELIWAQVPLPEDNSNYKAIFGIGTNFRNEIQLSGNTVSRFHATLKIDKKGKAFIVDHSKNGTTVNGQRISPNSPHQIKRSDAVVCGGVPVSVSQYLPKNNIGKILAYAAAVIVVIGLGFGIYGLIQPNVSPKTTQAMENASACVFGAYYVEVTLKDNPLLNEKFGAWPSKWYIGQDGSGNLICNTVKEKVYPFNYTGTAFFISKYGFFR